MMALELKALLVWVTLALGLTALGTGAGGVGTYTVSIAQTRASSTLTGRKDFQFMSDHSIAAADPGTAETGGAQGLLTAVKETAVEVA